MARDIQGRLGRLSTRRRGLDRPTELTMDSLSEVLAKADITESYQKRSSLPYTQYTLGAMQEVGPDYTRIGIEEATRVGKQLEKGLADNNIAVEFELQGSVPLNIHIRGVSDVDLLTLHTAFFTYDANGPAQHLYTTPVYYSLEDKMRELRLKAEKVLSDSYPAAKVDKNGNKAIKISGGSLRRAIDVVPSHWHHSTTYQSTKHDHERGVKVYNKGDHSLFLNLPFKHIKLITDRDALTMSGLKKAIRLCKNVRSDAINDGKDIQISSYEIAGLMWYCDASRLIVPEYNELSLLAVTQQHLDYLARNVEAAMALKTPDGSRRIIDNADRMKGLVALSTEMDDLAAEVVKEQANQYKHLQPTQDQIMESLRRSYVPLAS
jgi:hypothetical protein